MQHFHLNVPACNFKRLFHYVQKQPPEMFCKKISQNLRENTCARVCLKWHGSPFARHQNRSSYQSFSIKKVFWKISQNVQEKPCAISFLDSLLEPQARCFPVNFTKFLRTLCLQSNSWWLLPPPTKNSGNIFGWLLLSSPGRTLSQ